VGRVDTDRLESATFPSVIRMPTQSPEVPWPTKDWPEARPDADVDRRAVAESIAAIFGKRTELGVSLATVIVHRGRIVAERYGPDSDVDTTLISWSMAKSVTSAMIGLLVGDGLLEIDAPAPVAEFVGTDKAAITVRELLAMKSGLEFVEDYVDDSISHCLEMLFGSGINDHAHYAACLPLIHEPGTVWNYSSGTTNILARIAGDVLGGREAMERYMHDRLLDPIGMTSAVPKFDDAGTFVGSSYLYATARDFARFGLLYLRDGVWDGQRILPEGWVDYARTQVAVDEEPPHFGYGAHWWIWPDQPGSLAAHGYEGQYTIVVPARDLIVVHLGKVPVDVRPPLLVELRSIINAFPIA
jgi:CubicO group peptidase (beta-lactamase class C family)